MAKYIRSADRSQPMLLPAAVDDYVPRDSPLRALDAFVDSLDLGGLGFAVRCEGSTGRSSYDPSALLKLYLWGYLKRGRSSRGLEDACASNLGAIWLTGNLRPDHSTISDFRKRHAGPLRSIFKQFNLLCLDMGLFGRELVGIDGTFIKAVNSRAKSFTKTKLVKLIEGIDKAVGRYLDQLDTTDAGDDAIATREADRAELEAKIERIKARKTELEGYLERCAQSATGQVSLSDADSVQLCKGDKRTVGYNVQAAVDGKHHLVASVELTQEGNDSGQLNAMAQQAKEDMGLEPDAALEVLADAGYGTGAELAACEDNKTVTYVAIQKTRGENNGLYNEGDFTYEAGTDSYRCPAGETLARQADRPGKGGAGFRVYQNARACGGCPLKGRCTKGEFRRVHVSVHKAAVDAARERLAGRPGAMRERGGIAEHPFGTIKDRAGRHELLCKGLGLAKAEMGLSFWAYNFTRAINVLGVERLIEAARGKGREQAA